MFCISAKATAGYSEGHGTGIALGIASSGIMGETLKAEANAPAGSAYQKMVATRAKAEIEQMAAGAAAAEKSDDEKSDDESDDEVEPATPSSSFEIESTESSSTRI